MRGNSTVMLDAQRRLARGILVGLVTAVVLFVLFASGPNFGFSFAQQPSPAPPQIEFLNPSANGMSEIASDKPDGVDSTYHLVAWVTELPADPSVEFRYFDPDSNQEVSIGTGTQTGIADTFHINWAIPENLPEEDDITIYAILFSGTTEIDRDTEDDIFLNQQDPDPEDPFDMSDTAAETVEITYPAVGGAWGLFTPRDRATAGIIDVSHSDAVEFVRVLYSVSSPGTEPSWTVCGTENKAAAANGVRCTLSSSHTGNQVTAVGAIANDTPKPVVGAHSFNASFNDSGDAHRVQHYEQVPGTLSIDQATQDNAAVGACSRLFKVTLVDQFGISIPNANMDVHARGASDEIAFDDGTTASANKQPDATGHGTEPARKCSANPPSASGQQGDHDVPEGNDVKHIEGAVASGTDDAGDWTFQLFSPAAGSVEFAVWSDIDDDDLFCSTEKTVSGSVGFGQAASGSTLAPETSSCPSPSPTSPNPGPSTPGPTPTGTESPDPRGCTITGTDGAETIEGTSEDDVICAGDGDDVIMGVGGNDTIYGDEGRDDIRGGGGNDDLLGGSGKDTIRGNGGNDSLRGQDDNDVLTGGAGDDDADGGDGVDTVKGSGGSDDLGGQASDDTLLGGTGGDDLAGGPGEDILDGGPNSDRCVGGGGRDTLRSCER